MLPLNTALVHAFRHPREVINDPEWRGRVFEAAVGAALARSGYALRERMISTTLAVARKKYGGIRVLCNWNIY